MATWADFPNWGAQRKEMIMRNNKYTSILAAGNGGKKLGLRSWVYKYLDLPLLLKFDFLYCNQTDGIPSAMSFRQIALLALAILPFSLAQISNDFESGWNQTTWPIYAPDCNSVSLKFFFFILKCYLLYCLRALEPGAVPGPVLQFCKLTFPSIFVSSPLRQLWVPELSLSKTTL